MNNLKDEETLAGLLNESHQSPLVTDGEDVSPGSVAYFWDRQLTEDEQRVFLAWLRGEG